MLNPNKKLSLSQRFRGLLPVVVDIETSGVNPAQHAMLEIAIVLLKMDESGRLIRDKTYHYHIEPFAGAELNPESMMITGINVETPLRYAIPEQQALHNVFGIVRERLSATGCQRAVLVGHNAWFDLAFIQAALNRSGLKSPFHSFTTLDTASLSAVALGETVLARSVKAIGLSFDINKAHSAIYDAESTADLFCQIVNRYKSN